MSGNSFNLSISAEFYKQDVWRIIKNPSIQLKIAYIVEGNVQTQSENIVNISPKRIVNESVYIYQILVPTNVHGMTLMVSLGEGFDYASSNQKVSDINVLSFLEYLFPILLGSIIIGAALVITVSLYVGVFLPKNRAKKKDLQEAKSVLVDAVNVEHVLFLHKESGLCIYFESLVPDKIEPQLISGFISAISDFGKEMKSKEPLGEIVYGDKNVLITDGGTIRVAIVLSEKASSFLKKKVKELINIFEKVHRESLKNWTGDVSLFKDTGIMIDDLLNTSVLNNQDILTKKDLLSLFEKKSLYP